MLLYLKNTLKSTVILVATVLFSCDNSLDKVPNINLTSLYPSGVGDSVRLVYTDSTKIKAILTSKKYLDFSNQDFPYSEFPEGVKVTFFDKNGNKNIVTADYGIFYNKTNLVELKENVHLRTHDQQSLKTEQLFWDQTNQWIFTEKRFQFTGPETDMDAIRLDISRDFKYFSSGRVYLGEIAVEESTGS